MGSCYYIILVWLTAITQTVYLANDGLDSNMTNLAQPSRTSNSDDYDSSPQVRLSQCSDSEEMAGFNCLYVSSSGAITWSKGIPGTRFEVAGSPKVSSSSLLTAANTVSRMIRFMPRDAFTRLVHHGSVGIFTMEEKLTIFPEFSQLRNGDCGSSCEGKCENTCTFDGRKWDQVYGAGSTRAVALADNVICSPNDPYNHRMNILIHEMGHLVHRKAMDPEQWRMVSEAYTQAMVNGTWGSISYAMATEGEYFATATSVFFNANIDVGDSSGGMNFCSADDQVCGTEKDARDYLRLKDPLLSAVLVQVFNDDEEELLSGLGVCP